MRTFIFHINYHHWRTGCVIETKLGMVQAENQEAAEKKIWDIYGSDNASMPNSPIDVTEQETASFSIFAHNFK